MNSDRYKPSYYNFIIPVEEKRIFLLYNSLNGGLYEFPEKQGDFIESLCKLRTPFYINDISKEYHDCVLKLIDSHYFIKENVNEFQIYKTIYNKIYDILVSDKGRFSVTITPTLECNLACRYCFQDPSKNRYMSENTMQDIWNFMEMEIKKKEFVKNVQQMHITWFGGEPLLAKNIIRNFSDKLVKLCTRYNLEYEADVITNGTLLNEDSWSVLEECKIKNIQVTLDGSEITHNLRRPFEEEPKESYRTILNNLKGLSSNIHLAIRINCDKKVWDNIDVLFDDLEFHGIWPQKARQMNIDLAYVTRHRNSRFDDKEWYFKPKEFIDIKSAFIDFKWKRYNLWAEKNNQKLAKKKFQMPQIIFTDCITSVNPLGIVFDAEGYMFKCWEDVDKPRLRIQHVTDQFDRSNPEMSRWLEYSRLNYEKCRKCKFMPICETHCSKKMMEDKTNFRCSYWKYNLEKILKKQYIDYLNSPELYVI
jgi:uncharacterized protein